MINVAIVGPQEDKWTPEQKIKAKEKIKEILLIYKELDNLNHNALPILISGHCPKGGVDIWAEEVANELNIQTEIFKPQVKQWNDMIVNNPWDEKGWKDAPPTEYHTAAVPILGKTRLMGYKSRNIEIAKACDVLYCITPWQCEPTIVEDYKWVGCKHCKTTGHVSSGGCWTLRYVKDKLNKETHLIVIK